MKKLVLALGIAALAIGCRSSGANMSDTSSHTCVGKDCTDCTKEEMENCSQGEKTECKADGQVCPVTGKSIN